MEAYLQKRNDLLRAFSTLCSTASACLAQGDYDGFVGLVDRRQPILEALAALGPMPNTRQDAPPLRMLIEEGEQLGRTCAALDRHLMADAQAARSTLLEKMNGVRSQQKIRQGYLAPSQPGKGRLLNNVSG